MTPSSQVAFVAGAAAPVGVAISNYLAASGYAVVAIDIGLRPSGYADQVHLNADLAHPSEVKRVIAVASDVVGEPDTVVLALPAPEPEGESPRQALQGATEGWLDFTHAIGELMARRGGGHILFLLPSKVDRPTAGQALAAATQRAAVDAFSAKFAPARVRVNAIALSPHAGKNAFRDVLGAVIYFEQQTSIMGEAIHLGRLAA